MFLCQGEMLWQDATEAGLIFWAPEVTLLGFVHYKALESRWLGMSELLLRFQTHYRSWFGGDVAVGNGNNADGKQSSLRSSTS